MRTPALHPHDREILRLAVPAFFALVAEPLFLLGDAAVVGHLGTPELAGLGIAAVILHTVVGLCVFLAYGTTAGVARLLGAGRSRDALGLGIDGLYLAVLVGVVGTIVGLVATEPLTAAFGADDAVTGHAVTYLEIAWFGLTPLLVMLAATGVLRGLQDTRTPMYVAILGSAANLGLNVVLVYGLGSWDGLGIAGSALGSVIVQGISAVGLVTVVVRGARRQGASLRPDGRGILRAGRAGVPLLVRTLTLRAAILATAFAVSSSGTAAEIATHQLAVTLWGFLAFVLDAVAIAAQAITGRYLGAGDARATRDVTRRMVWWGVGSGVATGALLAATSPVLGRLFTPDAAVHELLVPVLLVASIAQPMAGVVFVLDGVLIGAGDGGYLAWAGLLAFVVHAPVVLAVGGSLTMVWVVFCALFMGARFVTLAWRARGDRWLVTGAG